MMRPEDITTRTFASALRGYDKNEVRAFLHKVAQSTQELYEQVAAAEEEVAAAAPMKDADEQPHDDGASAGPAGTVPDVLAGPPPEDHDVLDSPASFGEGITDLDAAEHAIVDRFGALGDRIADLLRDADESAAAIMAAAESDSEATRGAAAADAAQVRADAEQRAAELLSEARAIRDEVDAHRDEVMAELEAARAEQESALSEARTAAEAEVETFRVDSINEIEGLRSEARLEVDELRGSATTEVEELRASLRVEADTARESAIAEGRAAIAEDQAEAARLREEAENDRRAARAELDDVRTEVSGLLEQARTQSEFIKQEADEIIRTKVRANFEQAQARLDVLRNTEIASRERIVRAQTELSGALTRLDSEPSPELDPGSAPAVIEEAERRHAELGEQSTVAADVAGFGVDEAFEVEDPFDTGPVGGGEVGQATFEADVAEANEQIDAEGEGDSPLSAFHEEGAEVGAVDGAPAEPGFEVTEHVVVESSDDDTAAVDQADDPASLPEDASVGADALADALPPQADVGGHAEEDALARLVREAMQEAVDSARKDD